MFSRYENCDCKFHDITLTSILSLVFTFVPNYFQRTSLFLPGGHFNLEKAMIFGQLESAAILFAKFHAGTRTSLSDF